MFFGVINMGGKKENMSLLKTVKYLYERYLKKEKDPFTDIFEPIISHPKEGIQRRRFVRMGCIFPAILDNNKEHKVVIINMSGNGLFFVTPDELEKNRVITISSEIFDKKMEFGIRIIREEHVFSELKNLYSYGCEFINIGEQDRRFIIRNIFSNNRWLKEI